MDAQKTFEQSQEEGINLLGTQWLRLNERATNIALALKVNYRDKKVRAMITKIILETVKEIKK